jgi:arabinose-5-phosphate isomerase
MGDQSLALGRDVLRIEAQALLSCADRLDDSFAKAVEMMAGRGRIVVTGMGKSGLIGKKIAATLTSTGTQAVFLHPADALHGDMGIINEDDIVVALSTSGETEEVVRLIGYIKRIGVKLIAMVGRLASTLASQSDVVLDCSVEREACALGLVPTSSTTLTLAVGDALAMALMQKRGFKEEDFRVYHPGGALGKKLLKVSHLMHRGLELPLIGPHTPLMQVVDLIDEKRFGVGLVVDDDNHLLGLITDGDLRRLIRRGIDFNKALVAEVMTHNPMTIEADCLAVEALKLMEDRRITSLAVLERGALLGLIHLHDLWRTEMI